MSRRYTASRGSRRIGVQEVERRRWRSKKGNLLLLLQTPKLMTQWTLWSLWAFEGWYWVKDEDGEASRGPSSCSPPQGEESRQEEVERGKCHPCNIAQKLMTYRSLGLNCFPTTSISSGCWGCQDLQRSRCAAIQKKNLRRGGCKAAKPKKCAKWQSPCYGLRERRKWPQRQDTESAQDILVILMKQWMGIRHCEVNSQSLEDA